LSCRECSVNGVDRQSYHADIPIFAVSLVDCPHPSDTTQIRPNILSYVRATWTGGDRVVDSENVVGSGEARDVYGRNDTDRKEKSLMSLSM
jgi:hypothetical protein